MTYFHSLKIFIFLHKSLLKKGMEDKHKMGSSEPQRPEWSYMLASTRVAMICLCSPGIQCSAHGSFLWHHKAEIHPYQPCTSLPSLAQGRYWPFSIANKGRTKKLFKSKNPWNFVTETFKIGIIKWHLFFDLSNFYLVKLVSLPLLLRLWNQLY